MLIDEDLGLISGACAHIDDYQRLLDAFGFAQRLLECTRQLVEPAAGGPADNQLQGLDRIRLRHR